LFALDALTGQETGSSTAPTTIISAPVVANGTVYVESSASHSVYAFVASGGLSKILWTDKFTNNDAVGFSSPALANGVLYVVDNFNTFSAFNGLVRALDPQTGAILWESDFSNAGGNASSPVVADGMLFVSGSDGRLYSYALDAGDSAAYKWKRPPPPLASLHPNLRLKPAK
jgi:outer membrane protein assembly factor BamB